MSTLATQESGMTFVFVPPWIVPMLNVEVPSSESCWTPALGNRNARRPAPTCARTCRATPSIGTEKKISEETDIKNLWQDDFVTFLIGSGITFDEALDRAGVPTDKNRWVLRSRLPTVPAGRFHGDMVVTMRWMTPEQAIIATQVTSRFPFNHGAPLHIGDPAKIGADLDHPMFGGPVPEMPKGLVPVFWACGVTPQAAAEAANIDLMITHAAGHSFVTDLKADQLCIP